MFSPWTRLSSGSRTWRPGTAQPPNCNGKGEPPNTGSLQIICWGFFTIIFFGDTLASKEHRAGCSSGKNLVAWGKWRSCKQCGARRGGAGSSPEHSRHLWFILFKISIVIVTLDKGLPVSCSSCFEVDTRRACKEIILAICHICRSCANFQKLFAHILHFVWL